MRNRRHGYYWCPVCDERADGRQCEHGHDTEWKHVAMVHERPRPAGEKPKSVDLERGAKLFEQIYKNLTLL